MMVMKKMVIRPYTKLLSMAPASQGHSHSMVLVMQIMHRDLPMIKNPKFYSWDCAGKIFLHILNYLMLMFVQ